MMWMDGADGHFTAVQTGLERLRMCPESHGYRDKAKFGACSTALPHRSLHLLLISPFASFVSHSLSITAPLNRSLKYGHNQANGITAPVKGKLVIFIPSPFFKPPKRAHLACHSRCFPQVPGCLTHVSLSLRSS